MFTIFIHFFLDFLWNKWHLARKLKFIFSLQWKWKENLKNLNIEVKKANNLFKISRMPDAEAKTLKKITLEKIIEKFFQKSMNFFHIFSVFGKINVGIYWVCSSIFNMLKHSSKTPSCKTPSRSSDVSPSFCMSFSLL